MTLNELDPKGLIRESYRIDGISAPECRSIFLDWAMGGAQTADMQAQIRELLAYYGKDAPDHPMTTVLKEGLAPPAQSKRRGGRKARFPK